MKKRILMLLSVVALMVVMVASAVPAAFAHEVPLNECPGPAGPALTSVYDAASYDRNGNGIVCFNFGGPQNNLILRDDHVHRS
jgi:hypothetical protein